MNLTNEQYDAIQREYDAIQLKNRRKLEKRRDEIFEQIPAYAEASSSIASLSVAYGRRLLDGEPGAAKLYHEAVADLSRKKTELLLSAGYPSDYLDPIYDCPGCQDTGYTNSQRCHCFEQKIIRFLYAQSNLQEHLATENFSTLSYEYYEGDDLANFKRAVEVSLSFVKDFPADYKNLIFYGMVGTGKSFLSGCIAKELLERGHSVIYFSSIGLFNLLAQYSFQTNDKEMLYKTYEDLYNCDLVIVDDLGTEVTNSFTNSQFFSFINERHLRKKATIITTNLGIEELKIRYSERILSRLASNYVFRKLTGPDIRLCKNI